MKDIKKRFIDILFEPEDDPEEDDIIKELDTKKQETKEVSTISAKDILYRKPEQSAFINLEETSSTSNITKPQSSGNEYEFSSQISPIFGVLKETKQNNVSLERDINETFVNKPEDSHLEIITSPIYGYGTQEDMVESYKHSYSNSDDELHELLDNEQNNDYQQYGFSQDDHDDYLDYSLREDEDEEDITLFDMYDDEEF